MIRQKEMKDKYQRDPQESLNFYMTSGRVFFVFKEGYGECFFLKSSLEFALNNVDWSQYPYFFSDVHIFGGGWGTPSRLKWASINGIRLGYHDPTQQMIDINEDGMYPLLCDEYCHIDCCGLYVEIALEERAVMRRPEKGTDQFETGAGIVFRKIEDVIRWRGIYYQSTSQQQFVDGSLAGDWDKHGEFQVSDATDKELENMNLDHYDVVFGVPIYFSKEKLKEDLRKRADIK